MGTCEAIHTIGLVSSSKHVCKLKKRSAIYLCDLTAGVNKSNTELHTVQGAQINRYLYSNMASVCAAK